MQHVWTDATWYQSIHSTFVAAVNERLVGRTSDQDSRLRARELYRSLTDEDAPLWSVRKEFVPR